MNSSPYEKGNKIGGILLVAGCCIGAGMLGLPVLSAQAGFIPSLLTFVLSWVFMTSTGLLLLETNLRYGQNISIITMAEKTLGSLGKAVSWGVYLFLFYSLMVAYIAASGSLAAEYMEHMSGFSFHHHLGSAFFTLFFGALIYLGIGAVDWFNRILMGGLIISYILLVILGSRHVEISLLARHDWSAMTLAIPTMIISFGFHNLVPSLTTYFQGDKRALVTTILVGSAIPLFIYLLWEWLILGIVPQEYFKNAVDHGEIATESLKEVVGSSWVFEIAQSFAFFAIVTSFLSVALSFVDFLADGLNIKKTPGGKLILISLVLCPPLVCALIYPTIFLQALNYAGGYGAVTLFGILPVLMVWKGRYSSKITQTPILPGGKPVLIVIALFAIWVMALQMI